MLQIGDIIVLFVLLFGIFLFMKNGCSDRENEIHSFVEVDGVAGTNPRDILLEMRNADKNCVVFYGSQTGTAEGYAARLSKEGSVRFGLKAMAADLTDYDLINLDQFPPDKIVIFVMATYGEGDPTDSAAEFMALLNSDIPIFSQPSSEFPLVNLRYAAFGLGNHTYQHFNYIIRNLDKHMQRLGARRISSLGEGDDGAGSMEEDFCSWKELMWQDVAQLMGLREKEALYEPTFRIEEASDISSYTDLVYLGEPNIANGTRPWGPQNPFIAPILEMRELFTSPSRNCLHFEIDISTSGVTYNTGDHLAILPSNPGLEVHRFLCTFGLDSRRDFVFHLKSLDRTAKVPFPTPSTYETCLRYYMEICAPVTRESLSGLVEFAPNDNAKRKLQNLALDVELFHQEVTRQCLNIAQVCQYASPDIWKAVPFEYLIELLPNLRPRYYSISSSSNVQPSKVSVTALVDSSKPPESPYSLQGVTTNYLLALKEKHDGLCNTLSQNLDYALNGPRNIYSGFKLPVHVRPSKFRLPSNPSKPIVMVGPGTGIAPFRGFIQERTSDAAKGMKVGRMMLFYGCRSRTEDWIYKDDWEESKMILGENLTVCNAFSRDQTEKVYVQHLLERNGKLVNQILHDNGSFYVCGDARGMARAVHVTLVGIISRERSLKLEEAEEVVQGMRKSALYQEDVW